MRVCCGLWILIVLCGLAVIVSPASAIVVDVGATWISWEWTLEPGQQVDVYVDGVLTSKNSTRGSYLLSGMGSNERAHIKICDHASGDVIITNFASTTAPMSVVIAILVMVLVLAIISYGVDFAVGFVIGAFNIVLGIALLYFAIGMAMVPYLAMGALVFQVSLLGIRIYDQMSDALGWF